MPSCVNCGQTGHPANYRQCPAFKKFIQNKQQLKININKQQQFRTKSFNTFVNNNSTFANIVNKNKESNHNIRESIFTGTKSSIADITTLNTVSDLMSNKIPDQNIKSVDGGTGFEILTNDCKNLFGLNLIDTLRRVNMFMPSYKKIQNQALRSEALLSFIMNIADTS